MLSDFFDCLSMLVLSSVIVDVCLVRINGNLDVLTLWGSCGNNTENPDIDPFENDLQNKIYFSLLYYTIQPPSHRPLQIPSFTLTRP
jgi:hypothetical protein